MSGSAPAPRSPTVVDLPLTRAQESMWFLCRLARDSTVYNLPAAVRLRGPLDAIALRAAVQAIVDRHEILRTVFTGANGRPRQEVRPKVPVPLEMVDCSVVPTDEREERMREMARDAAGRPFDMAGGPLFRLVLYRFSDEEHVLLTVFHHLVWDGWSIGVFVAELAAHYGARLEGTKADLPPLLLQYADFALWERSWLQRHTGDRLRYWREALHGHAPLELPPDRARPPVQTYRGSTLPLVLPPGIAEAVERVSREADATPYMTLLTGFAALLHRWSGLGRFAVGTPVANRHQREVAPLIGFFANLLPVPVDAEGDPSFAELLERVKRAFSGALANQDIPFDSLVEGLGAGGDPSRNPLFQVVFALHHESFDAIALGDVAVEPVVLDADTTHFDLALHLWRRPGSVHGYFSFNRDLYLRGTVARLGSQFVTLLGAALRDTSAPLSTLPIVGEEERAWLEAREHEEETAGGERIPDVLEALTGEGALHAPGASMGATPGAVRGAALGAAEALAAAGVGRGGRVALDLAEPLDAAAGAWGAWRVGAVPVLPGGGGDGFAAVLRRGDGGLVAVPVAGGAGDGPSGGAAGDVAYESRTSGGEVAVTHRDLAARIARLQRSVPLGGQDVVCGLPGSGPDAFLLEVVWPLVAGARLSRDAGEATVLHASPAALARYLAEDRPRPAGLHTLVTRGGYLPAPLAERARARLGCKVVYLYAPPEAGLEVALVRADGPGAQGGLLGAGKPFLPVRVTDARGEPTPVGVPGTVWVRGRETADRGRWREDGFLELLGAAAGWAWQGGVRRPLEEIRRAILSDPSVLACHVAQDDGELFAFVVTAVAPAPGRPLKGAALPPGVSPRLVPVSHIPLDAEGRVDEAALLRLPVVDDELRRRWEEALRDVAGAGKAEVRLREVQEEQAVLHMDDLVPGWRRRRTADRSSSGESAAGGAPPASAGLPSSYCRGADLLVPDGAPTTMVEALERAAGRWGGDRGLTVYESATSRTFLSYAELLERARVVAAGLRARGLARGDRVILQMDRLEEHFVALWGCVLAGVAAVGVARAPTYSETNAVLAKLWNTWKLLGEPRLLASSPLCGPLREAGRLYGSAFEPIPFEELEAAGHGVHGPTADPGDVVFIQLTSGSTGVPKGVPETHAAIIAHALGAAQMNGYGEDDVSLNWLSLDHVVPMLTCHLKDTYLGLAQVHVRPQAVLTDPLLWLDLMEEHRVTLGWAPNFAFKLVNDALARARDRSWDLSALRRVMNAGEQVTLPVSAAWVRALAPHGVRPEVMQPAYGMAELATAVTYANDFTPETGARTVRKDSLGGVLVDAVGGGADTITFVDVGPPIPGVELRIATPAGETLPESVVGQVQARGRVTMPGYLNNPAANAESYFGDGWFDTGDLGFVHRGRLTVTGRTKEMIIVRGANFYCYEVEEVVNDTPGVLSTFSAVCAVDDPATGTEGMAVFFVPAAEGAPVPASLLRSVQENVAREFGVTPACIVPLERGDFPKTTSGKIQRTQLRRRLAAGDFDELLRRTDLALGRNTVPAWFLKWGWRPSRPAPGPGRRAGAVLVVDAGGRAGRGVRSAPLLRALGEGESVLVEAGEAFRRGEARRFVANPESAEDLERVLAEVDGPVGTVFLLEPSPGALLAASQALAAGGPVRVIVAATGALRAVEGDTVVPEAAGLRGLAETVPVEWPHLDVTLVDPSGEADASAALLAEAALADKVRSVAHRGGRRLVPVLEVPPLAEGGASFEEGSLVVVTGGLGGIGGEICRHLLTQYGVSLLVTGRSALDGGDGEEASEGLGRRKSRSERRATLDELRSLGGVMYRQAAAEDGAAMERAVAEAEAHFGTRVRGAVHLAGVFPARLLAEETPEGLAATLAPKLEGARSLDALLPDDALLVLFGSVYGSFGAAACGGYALANAALEGFALGRRGPTRVVAWSNWDDLGMSRGYALADTSRALGFSMVGRRAGLDSFDAALHAGADSLLVGLDRRRPNVSRHLDGPPRALRELVARHDPALDAAALAAIAVPDAAGRLSRCAFVRTGRPSGPGGASDPAGPVGEDREDGGAVVLPRTAAERTVAAIWQEVLELDQVDVDADFFSLGGQSILLLQVLARLEQSFGREVAVVDLFRYPTVRTLAGFLGEGGPERRTFDAAEERARKQRSAQRARARPRGQR